jgi:hypothetical protein
MLDIKHWPDLPMSFRQQIELLYYRISLKFPIHGVKVIKEAGR